MARRVIRYLADAFPKVAEEFDVEANEGFTPDHVAAGSHQPYWWKCSVCGHQWMASPNSRTTVRLQGCPVCGKKRTGEKNHTRIINEGKTLAKLYPDIAAEWDQTKNGDLTPNEVSAHTATKVWWLCKKCGYSWDMRVCKRTQKNGQGCPVCAGVRVVPGINDLKTVKPHLMAEWDYELNSCLPSEVTAHNNRRVHWVCSICGHRWTAMISDRSAGTGCPRCMDFYTTSLPEQIIYYYVKQVFPDTMNYRPDWMKNGEEIDIYIPSLEVGIEYDGIRWHQDPEKDCIKGLLIKDHSIQLIRVRDSSSQIVNDGSIRIEVSPTHRGYGYMDHAVIEIFKYINELSGIKRDMPDVNSDRDILQIRACYGRVIKERSFAAVCPHLISEWDYEENCGLNPEGISAYSELKVHWRCSECGSKWQALITSRTAGHGCPYCSGLKVREGVNDLVTMRPAVAAEWDYSANNTLPNKIAYRSNQKAGFICGGCGYHYSTKIADRSAGSGCPICAGKAVLPGVSDLATLRPDLIIDWDFEKNSLPPSSFKVQSNKVAAWKCHVCGYEWNAPIYSRSSGRGCMKCGKRSMAEKRSKRQFIAQKIQVQDKWLARKDILELCADLSDSTVDRALRNLVATDDIEKTRVENKTVYRWKQAAAESA